MSHWSENSDTLNTWLSKSQRGLILDMDGTLSPIVNHPDDAQVTPKNLDLLKELQQQLELVGIITGRAVADVRQKVGIEDLVYVGNHGMEHLKDSEIVVSPEIAAYRPNLESVIQQAQPHLMEGMWIEDKQTTLSIHYRNSPNPDKVSQEFSATITPIVEANELELNAGRMIFEIRPAIEINKGVAFRHLIETHQLDAALYIGDDTTDVDAFIVARELREANQCYSLAVGVESDDMPFAVEDNADMMVSGVSGVEDFLSWLSRAAKASST